MELSKSIDSLNEKAKLSIQTLTSQLNVANHKIHEQKLVIERIENKCQSLKEQLEHQNINFTASADEKVPQVKSSDSVVLEKKLKALQEKLIGNSPPPLILRYQLLNWFARPNK